MCAILAPALAPVLIVALLAAPPARAASEPRPPARGSAREAEPLDLLARFERPLARHGDWVRLPDGCSAWRPSAAGESWRPYLSGAWTWTDEGWFWVSEEPWAWATYHYGWWRHDGRLGWIWIPGVEWAPAWVVWRHGGGAVGWAPRSDDGAVLAAHWTFVATGSLAGARLPAAALHAARLPALLASSRPVEEPPVSARREAR